MILPLRLFYTHSDANISVLLIVISILPRVITSEAVIVNYACIECL